MVCFRCRISPSPCHKAVPLLQMNHKAFPLLQKNSIWNTKIFGYLKSFYMPKHLIWFILDVGSLFHFAHKAGPLSQRNKLVASKHF